VKQTGRRRDVAELRDAGGRHIPGQLSLGRFAVVLRGFCAGRRRVRRLIRWRPYVRSWRMPIQAQKLGRDLLCLAGRAGMWWC